MSFISFLIEAVLISLSGVMSPGPMTAASIGMGAEKKDAGTLIALGHGFVEIPLMLLIFYGFASLQATLNIKPAISFFGGVFLIYLGIGMLRSMERISFEGSKANFHENGIVDGIFLSAGNPYFIIWWATVGAALVIQAFSFGFIGFAIFAFVHWLCDLAWYSFLSVASFKSTALIGEKFQKTVFLISGFFLLFFGAKFILEAMSWIL